VKSKDAHRAVMGIFRDRRMADHCFNALLSRGYLTSDINLMMTERTRKQHYVQEHDGRAPQAPEQTDGQPIRSSTQASPTHGLEGLGVGGAIGTAAGATLAAIAAIGTSLVIPGLNLIVAGPIVAALAGGGAGALAGGFVGGLVGLGVQENDAVNFYRALQEGGVVMSVEGRPEDATEIKQLMIEQGGEQVCSCNC
jgi:hypothetical protein